MAFNPANTSATGGFIGPAPTSVLPAEDIALQDFLQRTISGVSGLDPINVRPRWQLTPPNLPDTTGAANWASYGILQRQASTFGYAGFDQSDVYSVRKNENIDLLINFYGNAADANATFFRDGLELGQNREVLRAAGFDSKYVGEMQNVPEFINQRWLPRVDISWRVSREVRTIYNILPIVSVSGSIARDTRTPAVVIPFRASS